MRVSGWVTTGNPYDTNIAREPCWRRATGAGGVQHDPARRTCPLFVEVDDNLNISAMTMNTGAMANL